MVMKFINEDTGAVKNAVFCFTGKSPKTRPEMTTIAINAGAQVTSSVTKQTTILVIADANSMSSKARKARERGIDLISPSQFFVMCNSAPGPDNYGQVNPVDTAYPLVSPNYPGWEKKPEPTVKVKHSLIRRIQL